MSETNFGKKFFLNDKLHNIYIYIYYKLNYIKFRNNNYIFIIFYKKIKKRFFKKLH